MATDHLISSVADFERILDEDPEVRERIRRRLLTDEERQLPSVVAQLAANLNELTQAVADGFARIQAQFQEVNARLDMATTERAEIRQDIKTLQDGQAEIRQDIKTLQQETKTLQDSQHNLRGMVLEQTAARRLLPRIAQDLQLRRPRVIHSAIVTLPEDITDILEDAVQQGRIDSDAADAVTFTDLIIQGVTKSDGTPVFVLAEVSGVLNRGDIDRALVRAATLEIATGQRTLAVAAATAIPAPQSEQAATAGVTLFLLD